MGKLHKSRVNKKLCGVCGGIAESLNIDPTILRLLVVILAILTSITFITVIIYIACALIMPYDDET